MTKTKLTTNGETVLGDPDVDPGVMLPTQDTTRKRSGRPREIDDNGTSLSVWLPTSAHERLQRLAAGRQQSLSAYVRDVLVCLTASRR